MLGFEATGQTVVAAGHSASARVPGPGVGGDGSELWDLWRSLLRGTEQI